MATQYYRYNALTRVISAEPRYIVLADGRTITNPSAEQYASLRDAYPKGEDAPRPEPQEGKVVVYGGYALGVAALMEAGVWAQVKAWIEANGLYDLYLAAQEFAEDNEYFAQGRTALQSALGWTDEQVEAVLAVSVQGSV